MKHLRPLLASVVLSSTFAAADVMPPERGRSNFGALLDIDADKARVVEAILAVSRERVRSAMEAIRTETDRQLGAVLTAEQLAKLRQSMPRPPRFGSANVLPPG